MLPDRNHAWQLLCEYTLSESLRRHALAVEACLRAYARRLGQDGPVWRRTGVRHSVDYEKWPNLEQSPAAAHPAEGAKILRQQDYPEEMVHAILAHASYTGVPRESALDHALFACDELSGFLTACALVRPSKSIQEVEAASAMKKLKDKAFARGVSRADVYQGAEELGLALEDHIAFCIAALRAPAADLGLNGQA